MPINPIFSNAMMGLDARAIQVRKARERREESLRKETFEQLSDEAELASLDQAEASRESRQVKSNETEDAADDHEQRGYYSPMGLTIRGKDGERPSVDLEG